MLVISAGEAAGPAAGPRPAILYGYGGFGISLTPAYSPNVLAWVEAGGVYAIAGAARRQRGRRGMAPGRDAGPQAERLRRLPRRGRDADRATAGPRRSSWASTAARTAGCWSAPRSPSGPTCTRPSVCSAPLLDMVRYERFGLGQTWNAEYGTAADAEQLGWLLAYSPYHHVTRRAPSTRPCCSPCSTTTPGSTRCTPARCARRCSTRRPRVRDVLCCCGPRGRSGTEPGR